MVRFRMSHFKIPMSHLLLPDYRMKWIYFDPENPEAPCTLMTWPQAWEPEEGRDFVHRVNSKHIARFGEVSAKGAYSALAIILCFVVITIIIVPQILQIVSALFFPYSRPPPTPPSPPQVPKNRKRLRLYYFRHPTKKRPTTIQQKST